MPSTRSDIERVTKSVSNISQHIIHINIPLKHITSLFSISTVGTIYTVRILALPMSIDLDTLLAVVFPLVNSFLLRHNPRLA